MDFKLTPEQEDIREMVRKFAEQELAPRVQEYNRREEYPDDLNQKMADLGLIGAMLPKEYGGSEVDHLSWAIMVEELARVCPHSAGIVGGSSSLLTQGILYWGTEEQKQKYLKPLCEGKISGAAAITEPNYGTDAAGMETTATKVDDGYIINGSKMWISNGTKAQWIMVFANLDKTKRHKGVTAFIVEADTPGLERKAIKGKLAHRTGDTAELYFDNCKIPKSALLGEEFGGWDIVMRCLDVGRIQVAAKSVGIAQGCLDACLEYAQERVVFGRPISQYQLIQEMITKMIVGIETSRMLTYKAAWTRDQGETRTNWETSMAKYYASETAMKVATDAIQIHGAYGISDEYKVERLFREAKVNQIVEGTSQLHTIMIAQMALGLRKRK